MPRRMLYRERSINAPNPQERNVPARNSRARLHLCSEYGAKEGHYLCLALVFPTPATQLMDF
jgi:hypothetical protein